MSNYSVYRVIAINIAMSFFCNSLFSQQFLGSYQISKEVDAEIICNALIDSVYTVTYIENDTCKAIVAKIKSDVCLFEKFVFGKLPLNSFFMAMYKDKFYCIDCQCVKTLTIFDRNLNIEKSITMKNMFDVIVHINDSQVFLSREYPFKSKTDSFSTKLALIAVQINNLNEYILKVIDNQFLLFSGYPHQYVTYKNKMFYVLDPVNYLVRIYNESFSALDSFYINNYNDKKMNINELLNHQQEKNRIYLLSDLRKKHSFPEKIFIKGNELLVSYSKPGKSDKIVQYFSLQNQNMPLKVEVIGSFNKAKKVGNSSLVYDFYSTNSPTRFLGNIRFEIAPISNYPQQTIRINKLQKLCKKDKESCWGFSLVVIKD